MKKTLPETGGRVLSVLGYAEEEARIFRERINSSKDELMVDGKKFYVSQNGDDQNDGTSPEKAFKTLDKVREISNTLKSGDGVFLERNSIFRTNADLDLVSGVTYAAYGEGDKPQVYGSEKNYAQNDIWVASEIQNVWMINPFLLSDVGIIVLDGGSETGKKQMNLDELTENDDFYHDWDEKILYFYCDKGNPAEVFSQIEIGTKTRIFHMPQESHDIRIDNIGFSYAGIFGVRGSGLTKNITITNCTFAWIGGSLFANKSNRFGNAIEFAAGCEDILVKNCSFDQIFDTGVTFQIESSPFRNFVVEDCLFEYNGMSGFEWWTGGNQGEKDGLPIDITIIENIKIQNNLMRLTGFGWSKAVRSPTHIRNGWSPKWYPNMKGFVIENNIFDYVNGPIIASGWRIQPDGYKICNNTYYQSSVELNDDEIGYVPFASKSEEKNYASCNDEFISAVNSVDNSPKKIKWITKM